LKQLLAYAVAALGVAVGGLINAWLGYSKGGETGEAWSLLGLTLTLTVGPGLVLAGLFAVRQNRRWQHLISIMLRA